MAHVLSSHRYSERKACAVTRQYGVAQETQRSQMLPFLARQSRCIVAVEACASAHFWGRAFKQLGHDVRLIPPNLRKAICEAAVLQMHRRTLKQQFGLTCVSLRSNHRASKQARWCSGRVLYWFGSARIALSRCAVILRNAVLWLGLMPLQRSTCGKQVFGRTSKMGQRDIRRLLITDAMTMMSRACRRAPPETAWLSCMLERKPRFLVAIALANKMARSVRAILTNGEDYTGPVVVGPDQLIALSAAHASGVSEDRGAVRAK